MLQILIPYWFKGDASIISNVADDIVCTGIQVLTYKHVEYWRKYVELLSIDFLRRKGVN